MLGSDARIASVPPSATWRGKQARGQLLAGFINAQTATHNIAGSSLSPAKEAGPGYSTGPRSLPPVAASVGDFAPKWPILHRQPIPWRVPWA